MTEKGKEMVVHETTGELVVQDEVIIDYLTSLGNTLREPDKKKFLHIARAYNLNPFMREIYGIPYGNNFNIIVGYEVYIKRAERTGLLTGWRAYTEGTGNDMKGCVKIYKKGWVEPFYHEVYMEEYRQNNNMWKTKPRTMLKKVAIAQGFRMAFPVELGGIPLAEEELGSHGQEDVHEITDKPAAIAEMLTEPPVEEALAQGMEEGEVLDAQIDEHETDEPLDETFLKREMGKINRLKSSKAVQDWWTKKKDDIKSSTNLRTSKEVYDYVLASISNWQELETQQHEQMEEANG